MSFQILITCVGTFGIITRINRSMEDKLIPRTVYRRQQDQQKLRKSQKSTMDVNWMERDRRDFDQTQNAAQDSYMSDALAKVRQSDVTHSETVTRLNGTWMFNKSLKN